MKASLYGIWYRGVAIAICSAEELLMRLSAAAEARQSLLVAPITLRELFSIRLSRRMQRDFSSLTFTFSATPSVQRALVKELEPDKWILPGKIFIELTEQIAVKKLALLVWGVSDEEEIQLKNRFKLLLGIVPKAIYLSETIERSHSKEQIETFVRKTDPHVVYMTWCSYQKFPHVAKLLPKAVIVMIDIPLSIYTELPPRNVVFAKIGAFLGLFNPWRGVRALCEQWILIKLKKNRGNLKHLY